MDTTLLIIIAAFAIPIIIFLSYLFWKYIEENARCDKCNKKLVDVDSWGYKRSFKSSTRYRCSVHPLKGYKKIFLENKHWKTEVSNLSDAQKIKIKRKEILSITMKDFGFSKITKTYKPETRSVLVELSIDKRKITIKEKGMGIYLITNKQNGKMYVGQSVKIDNRWKQHLISNNPDGFHNDLNKAEYKFEVLMNSPKEFLNFFEAYYITKYNSYNDGYNKTKGNFSHLSAEQIRLLGEIRR